jgi:hypothetical protein
MAAFRPLPRSDGPLTSQKDLQAKQPNPMCRPFPSIGRADEHLMRHAQQEFTLGDGNSKSRCAQAHNRINAILHNKHVTAPVLVSAAAALARARPAPRPPVASPVSVTPSPAVEPASATADAAAPAEVEPAVPAEAIPPSSPSESSESAVAAEETHAPRHHSPFPAVELRPLRSLQRPHRCLRLLSRSRPGSERLDLAASATAHASGNGCDRAPTASQPVSTLLPAPPPAVVAAQAKADAAAAAAAAPWPSAGSAAAGASMPPPMKRARRGGRKGSGTTDQPEGEASSASPAGTKPGKAKGKEEAPSQPAAAPPRPSARTGPRPARSRSPVPLAWGLSAAPGTPATVAASSSSSGAAASSSVPKSQPSAPKSAASRRREKHTMTPTQLAEFNKKPIPTFPPFAYTGDSTSIVLRRASHLRGS